LSPPDQRRRRRFLRASRPAIKSFFRLGAFFPAPPTTPLPFRHPGALGCRDGKDGWVVMAGTGTLGSFDLAVVGAGIPLLQRGLVLMARRLEAEQADEFANGIHLITVQSAGGSLVVGHSHHYARTPDPFAPDAVRPVVVTSGTGASTAFAIAEEMV
jgi:hypothetical protein